MIYQNSTYGISIQYPAGWTVNKTNNSSDNNSSPINNIVWFYPQHDAASVSISIDFPDPRVTNDLTTYLNFAASSLSQGSLDERFNVIKSSTTKLGGLPAYSLEYSSTNAEDNTTYVTLELGTIISGKVLIIDYTANSPSFDKFLPTAFDMINSMSINKSAIEHLTFNL